MRAFPNEHDARRQLLERYGFDIESSFREMLTEWCFSGDSVRAERVIGEAAVERIPLPLPSEIARHDQPSEHNRRRAA